MLHEQRLGLKAIIKLYPDKNWKLSMVKSVCLRIDVTISAMVCKPDSRWWKSVRIALNIIEVSEMLCSQEDQPGTKRSTQQIASELEISE